MAARVGSGTFPSIGVYLSLKSDVKVQLPDAIYMRGAILFVVLFYYFIFDIALRSFKGAQDDSRNKITDVAQGGVGCDLGKSSIFFMMSLPS